MISKSRQTVIPTVIVGEEIVTGLRCEEVSGFIIINCQAFLKYRTTLDKRLGVRYNKTQIFRSCDKSNEEEEYSALVLQRAVVAVVNGVGKLTSSCKLKAIRQVSDAGSSPLM